MDIRKAFKGKFMKAGDFDGPEVLTITKVYRECVGQDKEEKPVVHFQGCGQGLVLNATNAGVIAGIYGWETQDWKGKEIEIYPTTTEFGGKVVDCLRVRKTEVDETKFIDDPLPTNL